MATRHRKTAPPRSTRSRHARKPAPVPMDLGPDADEEIGSPVPAPPPPASEGAGFTGGQDNPFVLAMTPAPVSAPPVLRYEDGSPGQIAASSAATPASARTTTCSDCPHDDHPGRPCEADGECFCGTDLKGRLGNEAT